MKGTFLRREEIFLLLLFSSFNILILLFAKEWPNYIGWDIFIFRTPQDALSRLEASLLSLPLIGKVVGTCSLLFGLFFMYPLASRLTDDAFVFLILSISLSLYVLTFFLFLTGALGFPFHLTPAILFTILVFLVQQALFEVRAPKFRLPSFSPLDKAVLALILFVLLLLSFRTLYFPFIAEDTLGRYGLEAKYMYFSRKLMSMNDYPLMIPLSYLYAYLSFGGVYEHLAKLIDVIFAWMMVYSVYLFGKTLFDKRVGLLSALSFCLFSWFALGEPPTIFHDGLEALDVPSNFFFTTSLLFFLNFLERGKRNSAILSGLMLGAGLWCKHSSLLLFPLFISLTLLAMVNKRDQKLMRGLFLTLFLAVMMCFSFYVSNLRFRGYVYEEITPADTQFYNPIEPARILLNAFMNRKYLILLSLLSLPYSLKRYRVKALMMLLPAVFVFSYWSYVYAKVPRYLFLMSSPLSVFSGLFLREVVKREAFVLLLLLLASSDSFYRVAGREVFLEIVRKPFMTELEKRQLTLGSLYDISQFVVRNTTGKVYVVGTIGALPYFLEEREFGGWVPRSMEELDGYDIFVMDSSPSGDFFDYYVGNQTEVFDNLNDERYFKKLYNKGRFTVYEICFPECSFQG